MRVAILPLRILLSSGFYERILQASHTYFASITASLVSIVMPPNLKITFSFLPLQNNIFVGTAKKKKSTLIIKSIFWSYGKYILIAIFYSDDSNTSIFRLSVALKNRLIKSPLPLLMLFFWCPNIKSKLRFTERGAKDFIGNSYTGRLFITVFLH